MPPRRHIQLALVATAVLQLSARPCFAQSEPADPWERTNRRFYAIHMTLDRAVLRPAALAYGKMPRLVRKGLRHVARNLGEPVIFVNDMLQGHVATAASTAGRFTINSTVGIVGLVDVAKKGRIPHHDNDFGLTLGRWGVGSGPYLFIPLFGPTTVRDGLGAAADIGLNPLTYLRYDGKTAVSVSAILVNGLDRRLSADQELKTVEETSTDPYATIRSYYLQSRQAQIGEKEAIRNLPSFDEPAPTEAPPEGAAPAEPAAPAAPPSAPQVAPPPAPASPAPPAATATPTPPGPAPSP